MQDSEKLKFAKLTYKNCSAYNKFLHSKGIKSLHEFPISFKLLPLTNKKNYIERYSTEKRLAKRKLLSDYYMICTSSGSTGTPTIWPRDYTQDEKAIAFNLQMYKELFQVDKKRTLVVVTFGLGAWTAGMLTSRLCWEASKSAKLSVVTPGLDKVVALRAIKELGSYYDQTILTGYPPFIADLIDYGISKKFDFKKINTKIHFTSARVLEEQRDELVRVISKKSLRHDVLGFYASSEAGIIGIETPETVDILEVAAKDKEFSKALFNNQIPPTFVIYNPNIRYLEVFNNRIIISVDQAIPLVRYDTKDRGGIFDGQF
jgi:phenylacetate-CoA ligase